MFDDFEGIETISCSIGDPPDGCEVWDVGNCIIGDPPEWNKIWTIPEPRESKIEENMLEKYADLSYTSSSYDMDFGGVEMSLVGIEFFDGNIIGFADSKLTRKYGKKQKINIVHPNARKIFWNSHYVIVFSGTSGFYIRDGNGGAKEIYLEDLVKERINQCNSPDVLCLEIHTFLKANCETDFAPFSAIAGYYKADEMYSFETVISPSKYEFRCETQAYWTIKTGSVEFYKDYINEFAEKFYTTDEAKLKRSLESAKQAFRDKYPGEYDPVGGDWTIHILNKATDDTPNSETIEAMKETEEMIANKDKGKLYDSFSEIVKEVMET